MYLGMNYVNGDFQPHRPDFSSINPANLLEVGLFPASNDIEISNAVNAARQAFPKWRALSRVQRADLFDNLCQILKRRKDVIAVAISTETGKNYNESMAEVVEALHMAQYCFAKGREPMGSIVASELPERDSYTIRKPKGVVASISPWNFPFAIGGFWTTGPALLEGNTVVLKPSEETPMVGQIIAELYDEAGFPPGVFNLIHGDGRVGDSLARMDVDHICFTGSPEVGQHIRKICADSLHKTCSCELGSKSACIVFPDADIDLAVSASLASAFKLSGQRCVSSGRILVHRAIFEQFRDLFVEKVEQAIAKPPFEAEIESTISFGPLINKNQMDRVEMFNEMVRNDLRANVLFDPDAKCKLPDGYFLRPFVYSTEWRDAPYLKQEVFGPHVALIPFNDLDDAIRIYNDTKYGLALGVMTNDFRTMREIRNRCDFGMLYFNLGSIGAESHFPFGGVKASGNGSPSAAGTFDAVCHKVSVSVNHGGLNFPQGLK